MVDDLLNTLLVGIEEPEPEPAPAPEPAFVSPTGRPVTPEAIRRLFPAPDDFLNRENFLPRFGLAFGKGDPTSTGGLRFQFSAFFGKGQATLEFEKEDLEFLGGQLSPLKYKEIIDEKGRTQQVKNLFNDLFNQSIVATTQQGLPFFSEDEKGAFRSARDITIQVDFDVRSPFTAFFGGEPEEFEQMRGQVPGGFTRLTRVIAEPLRRISGFAAEILEAGKTPLEEASAFGYVKNTGLSALGFITGIPGFLGETGERAVESIETAAQIPILGVLGARDEIMASMGQKLIDVGGRDLDFLKGFGGVVTPLVESYLAESSEERAIKAEEAERLAFEDPIAAGAPILAILGGRAGLKRMRRSKAMRNVRFRMAEFNKNPTPTTIKAFRESLTNYDTVVEPSKTSVFIKSALKKPIDAIRRSEFGARAEFITEALKETAVGKKVSDITQSFIERAWRTPSEINSEAFAKALEVEAAQAKHLFKTRKDVGNLEARASLGLDDAAIKALPLGEQLLNKFVDSFNRIPVMKEFMRRATGKRGFKLTAEERAKMFTMLEGMDYGPGGEPIFGARERVVNAVEQAAFIGRIRELGGLKTGDAAIDTIRADNLQLPDAIFKKKGKTIPQLAQLMAKELDLPEIRAADSITKALNAHGLDNLNKIWRTRELPDGTIVEMTPERMEGMFNEFPVHQQQVLLDMRSMFNELVHVYDIGKGRTVKIEQLNKQWDVQLDQIAKQQLRNMDKIERDFNRDTRQLANAKVNGDLLNRLFKKAINENDATLLTRIERITDQLAERTPEIQAVHDRIKVRLAMSDLGVVEPAFRPLTEEIRKRTERLENQRNRQRVKVEATFNEMLDRVNRSTGAEIQRLEAAGLPDAYVHHFFAKNGFLQSLMGVLRRRGKIKAGPRKFRKGAQGFETNPFEALFKEKVALERERIINDALPEIERQLAVPLETGEAVPVAHFETVGKFGELEGRRIAIHSAFEPQWNRFSRSLNQDAFDGMIKAAGTYYKQTLLFSPDQVLVQSYGIMHELMTKTMVDFVRDVFRDDVTWREIQGPARGFARAFKAIWDVERMDPLLRDVLAPEQFTSQRALGPEAFRKGLPIISPIMEQWMRLVALPDKFGKITIGIREIDRVTKNVDRAIRAGEITEVEGVLYKKILLRDPKVMQRISQQINIYAFDYADVSLWLEKWRNSGIGIFTIPFATFGFKSLKSFQFHVWDSINPKSGLLPKERIARLVGYGLSMMPAVFAQQMLMGPVDSEDTEGGGVVDVSDHVHAYSYEKEGKQYHVYINFGRQSPRLAIAQALSGGSPWSDFREFMGEDFQTLGGFARLAARYVGLTSKYDQYKPTAVVVGEQVRVFIPASRILQNLGRLSDPLRRRPQTFFDAIKAGIPGFREQVPPSGRPESQLQAGLSVAGIRSRVLEEQELLQGAARGAQRRELEEQGLREVQRLQNRIKRVGRETGLTEEEREAAINQLIQALEEAEAKSERIRVRELKQENREFQLNLRRTRQNAGISTND